MKTYRLTPAELHDISEIETNIFADDPIAVVKLIQCMIDVMRKLAQFPGAGTRRMELDALLRSFMVQNYSIVFREVPEGVEIARVLHAARDIEAEFE